MESLLHRDRGPTLVKCLNRWAPRVFLLNQSPQTDIRGSRTFVDNPRLPGYNLPPAADCPPDFAPLPVREEYRCDAVLVGRFRKEHVPYLAALEASGLSVRAHGEGWPVTWAPGYATIAELPSVYASARCVIDLDGQPSRILAIWACDGVPVAVGNNLWTQPTSDPRHVVGLEECYWAGSPEELVPAVMAACRTDPDEHRMVSAYTRLNDTLTARLKMILEVSC